MVTLRVRPGFTHGAQKQYKAGDLLVVDEAEAAVLLAAFGDKLETVAGAADQEVGAPSEAQPAVMEETAEVEPEEGRPGGRRSRRSKA